MDPTMTAVAVAVAGKITETLTASAREALGRLADLVKQRFASDGAAQQALTAAKQAPDDADRVAELAKQLERLAAQDPKFAEQLRGIWSQARTELSAQTGGIVNNASGTISGPVVQARDVQGGIKFGN